MEEGRFEARKRAWACREWELGPADKEGLGLQEAWASRERRLGLAEKAWARPADKEGLGLQRKKAWACRE